MIIAEKAKVSPSATVTINSLAASKKSQGEHIYNFAAGDPVLKVHPCIIDGAKKALEKGYCPYAPVAGMPELRNLAAEWMTLCHKAPYKASNTLVTCGGKYALFAALYSLLNDQDEVLIPAPHWVSYPEMVKLCGGIPRIATASHKNGWKITAADLEKHVNHKTKVLILNNACNPTGVLYSKDEIKDLLVFAKKHNLIVISDEVYSNLVYDGNIFVSCGSFLEHQDHVVIIQSCSKNMGMTGMRVGFAFAPENLIRAMTTLQGQSTTGTSSHSQWAAIAAIENFHNVNLAIKTQMQSRRDVFVEEYNKAFKQKIIAPPSGLYVFSSLKDLGMEGENSVLCCEKLLKEKNVALVPGSAFGVDGYVRWAFSETEQEILMGLAALTKDIL